MGYDVFISYRRSGGDMLAHILYDRLKSRGYKVFQDVESLRSGKFNEALYDVIQECKDFLLVLPPNALDRCVNEKDWVRLEVEYAIANNKNIIPIKMKDFTFPDNLPDSMNSLLEYNIVNVSTEYFEQFLNKLEMFLLSDRMDCVDHGEIDGLFRKYCIRNFMLSILVVLVLGMPMWLINGMGIQFSLFYRILYFCMILLCIFIFWNIKETNPAIAKKCYYSITEKNLKNSIDVFCNELMGMFGRDIFLDEKHMDCYEKYCRFKRLEVGSWDGININYFKVVFRIKLEYYDPSVFYIHALSTQKQAVKMLLRQGFMLKRDFRKECVECFSKQNIYVLMHFRKKHVDFIEIFLCDAICFRKIMEERDNEKDIF